MTARSLVVVVFALMSDGRNKKFMRADDLEESHKAAGAPWNDELAFKRIPIRNSAGVRVSLEELQFIAKGSHGPSG